MRYVRSSYGGEANMPAQFILARRLPDVDEEDIYEAIKAGRKTSEFRDATPYWATRLLNDRGLRSYYRILKWNTEKHRPACIIHMFSSSDLKHRTARFRVGHTKAPVLDAKIRSIYLHPVESKFEIRVYDVHERVN